MDSHLYEIIDNCKANPYQPGQPGQPQPAPGRRD